MTEEGQKEVDMEWMYNDRGDVREREIACSLCGYRDVYAERLDENGEWAEYVHYPCSIDCPEQGTARRG